MIDVKELRVGNHITGIYSDGDRDDLEDMCIVMALDETGEILGHKIWVESKKSNSEYFSEFKGIPLTEELLKKAGLFNGFEINDCKVEVHEHFAEKNTWFFHIGNLCATIKFVHDFQNWYYYNNEKELEL